MICNCFFYFGMLLSIYMDKQWQGGESMDIKKRIEMIEKDGLMARGKKDLIRHLEGGRLTHRQAIHAHCYDCMCYFIDGRADCRLTRCSLYPFMIFNKNRIKSISRKLSEEHIEKMQGARKKSKTVNQ